MSREKGRPTIRSRSTMNKRSITIFALVATFSVGWYLRFEDVRVWRELPDLFYMNDEPVLINADGF